MHEDMNRRILGSEAGHRDRWLALLDKYGVVHPKSLHLMEVPGGLVQATLGEPPGRICLDGTPGHVLMFNLSPVQALRQTRGRSFTSNMLHGEMTLMPSGVPSQWSWNSTCDRLDVIISPDVFGDNFAVVDRFLFRDPEMEVLCHSLYRAVSLDSMADRLYVESLVAQLAVLIRQRHSTASVALRISAIERINAQPGAAGTRLHRIPPEPRADARRAGEDGRTEPVPLRTNVQTDLRHGAAPICAAAPGGARQRDAALVGCQPRGNQLIHGFREPEPLHQHLPSLGRPDTHRIQRT